MKHLIIILIAICAVSKMNAQTTYYYTQFTACKPYSDECNDQIKMPYDTKIVIEYNTITTYDNDLNGNPQSNKLVFSKTPEILTGAHGIQYYSGEAMDKDGLSWYVSYNNFFFTQMDFKATILLTYYK